MPGITRAIFNADHSRRGNFSSQVEPVLPLGDRFLFLFRYIRRSEASLERIRADFSQSQSGSKDPINIKKPAKRLSEFCVDTDRWGFDAIYRAAFGMQALLVISPNRIHDDNFRDNLSRGWALLRAQLKECESVYHQRLAVDDMLERFGRATSN